MGLFDKFKNKKKATDSEANAVMNQVKTHLRATEYPGVKSQSYPWKVS
jgi:hypothetical protein